MPSFFDTREQLTGRPTPAPPSEAPLTPSTLNRRIEQILKGGLPASFLIRGELSNFNRHRTSGHCYFTLKDAQACVDCVMFAGKATSLRFEPADGLEVLITGSIGVYAPRGRYQVYANRMDPVGEGALELAKRQLEAKLNAEGLFAPDRKRPIPAYPRTIVLVTSPQAAGFADMLKVLRRFKFLRLLVYPVPVQGATAGPAIAQALRHISEEHESLGGIDVVLLGRGGGSLEDLWAFNEEIVARAVAKCGVPIVTGIGHEIDVSIADLVADYHAHTPTEAATVVTQNWRSAINVMEQSRLRLSVLVRSLIDRAKMQLHSIARHEFFRKPASILDPIRQRIDDLETRLLDHGDDATSRARDQLHEFETRLAAHRPTTKLAALQQRLSDFESRSARAGRGVIESKRRQLESTESLLRALGPVNVLKRGYTITSDKRTGKVLRSPSDVRPGDVIVTTFAEGEVRSTVDDQKQGLLFDRANDDAS
ncbi:MAG: exodeoxyribonuclease VII large subunit [Tepidisphaeraceae bacterium]